MTALNPIRNGRLLVYPAEVILNTDILRSEIFRMVDISMLAQTIIGGWPTPTTIAAGLNCTPTVTPAFSVTLAPGVIYQYEELDATDYPADSSGVAADTTQSIFKQGITLPPIVTPNTLTPGIGGGNSIAYLIQIQLSTIDTESTTRQYYNPSSPPNPITLTAPDLREDTIAYTIKASSSAPSPIIPTPDSGYIGLWVVTVPNGATVITSGMIAPYSATSFVTETLPQKVSYTNLQNSSPIYGLDTGTANVYAIAPSPAYAAIQAGTIAYMKAAHSNTGTSTFNVNGLGANPIKIATSAGLVVLGGEEIIAGNIYQLMYTGTEWELLNPESVFISSLVLAASAITLVDSVASDVTSILLPIGNWNVKGNVAFVVTGTPVFTAVYAWSNLTSTTLPDPALYNITSVQSAVDFGDMGIDIPSIRFNLVSPTTIYLSARANFGTPGSVKACGFIFAERS